MQNNYTLMTDFYELTMAQSYFNSDQKNRIVYFPILSFLFTIRDLGLM